MEALPEIGLPEFSNAGSDPLSEYDAAGKKRFSDFSFLEKFLPIQFHECDDITEEKLRGRERYVDDTFRDLLEWSKSYADSSSAVVEIGLEAVVLQAEEEAHDPSDGTPSSDDGQISSKAIMAD
ncbi:UNVERIFIED_CONTAM: hypothetical protein K2H54_061423 [Gekko kuhli]